MATNRQKHRRLKLNKKIRVSLGLKRVVYRPHWRWAIMTTDGNSELHSMRRLDGNANASNRLNAMRKVVSDLTTYDYATTTSLAVRVSLVRRWTPLINNGLRTFEILLKAEYKYADQVRMVNATLCLGHRTSFYLSELRPAVDDESYCPCAGPRSPCPG